MINQQIYSTSLDKALSSAKTSGKLNLTVLNVFYLYMYYIDFAQSLSDLGSTQFEEHIIFFKKELSKLKYKYPDVICNYKTIVTNISTSMNTAPTVDSVQVNMSNDLEYPFEVSRFTFNYADVEGHSYKYLLVYPDTLQHGVLLLNGVELTTTTQINIENLISSDSTGLVYNRTNTNVFTDELIYFRISDNPVDYLYSTLESINVIADEPYVLDNLPLTDVGDLTLYVQHGVTTILTLDMFTNQLIAPYNDPEGDLIDAIRIIDVSNANEGQYLYNGIALVDGQIITREELNSGAFTHVGADAESVRSDTLEFEARDTGSLIWVS
jgi:hypothetical protein